jgi:hypothetical protein
MVTAKLARALSEAGVEVTVVTREHPGDRMADSSARWKEGIGTVHRLPPPGYPIKAANYLAKARRRDKDASWFSTAAKKFCVRELNPRSFDWVMSRAGNADAMEVALHLKRKYQVPWLASITDPFPYCFYPEPYGAGRAETIFDRSQAAWTAAALADADHVIFPSERLARHLCQALGLDPGRRPIVSPHIGYPTETKTQPDPGPKFEVLHTGSIGLPRVKFEFFTALADAVGRLPGLSDQVRINLVGSVAPDLVRRLAESGLEKMIAVRPLVSYDESLGQMARAGALLLLEAPMKEGIFLPSKFCDYAVSGRPLLLFGPETGTISDHVGGLDHPGFLGQQPENYLPGLERFLERVRRGGPLDDYAFPDPDRFAPDRVARDLLEAIGSPPPPTLTAEPGD